MRLIDLHPQWVGYSAEQVLAEMSADSLHNTMMASAEYYQEHLPLWQVLQHYGVENVDASTETAHVACKLSSHAGEDRHASARYFTIDRDTGETKPAFYCYKCQKVLNSFWFTYRMQKDDAEDTLREIYIFIWKTFGVPMPVELWFEYDQEKFYTFDDHDVTIDASRHFMHAEKVRALKATAPLEYLGQLKALMMSQAASAPRNGG